ncbi:MAG: carboxylating nicotinate-nucleotide diphosphorylase [Chitinophagia bacterium]|nr:carboxylating nicotinate-nucleotide diphosphorylase [Chitinophagia bacterium]
MNTQEFIIAALAEDIGSGDHSTLASIDAKVIGTAKLIVKEAGIIAGIRIAKEVFLHLDKEAIFTAFHTDGEYLEIGTIAFTVKAKAQAILQAERLVLNTMQRMSGIATLTHSYVEKIKNYSTSILDTRKTTPLFRAFEKEAVLLGGAKNHRMGLYDMIMLKDNHIDYCGGIEKAIAAANAYLKEQQLQLPIEVETRSLDDVKRVVKVGGVQRIMLDNFTPQEIKVALEIINKQFETEASGGINFDTIEAYAATGVDFISVGAVIHHATSLDLSLKAVLHE